MINTIKKWFKKPKTIEKPPKVLIIQEYDYYDGLILEDTVIIFEARENCLVTRCIFKRCIILHVNESGKICEGYPPGKHLGRPINYNGRA